jgi:hypothetical protein
VYHRMAACHFSELVLEHSPELKITQTIDDVQAALEYGPEPTLISEHDRIADAGPGPGVLP